MANDKRGCWVSPHSWEKSLHTCWNTGTTYNKGYRKMAFSNTIGWGLVVHSYPELL